MQKQWYAILAGWFVSSSLALAADPAPTAPPRAPLAEMASANPAEEVIVWESAANDNRWWFNAEYLLWWIEDHPLPVPVLSTGTLGVPGSLVILGGTNVVAEERHGGRFTLGGWINDEQTVGLEANYFFLGRRTDNQSAFSSGLAGSPIQGIPFLAAGVLPPTEAFFTLAVPGAFANLTSVAFTSFLEGTEIGIVGNVRSRNSGRIDLIGGFRYLNLDEKLAILHSSPPITPGPNTFIIEDAFDTRNQFYGGQLGLRARLNRGRFFADLSAKVALGGMNEEANINGFFLIDNAPFFGGIFTQPSNIGQHHRSELAWLHELTLNVGVEVRTNVRAFVGYNFLWISDVLRPGNQIDRAVNLAQAPLVGLPFPAPRLVDSSFWVQGINFGVQLRY